MQTLNSFVESVWTADDTLIDPEKPDPNTGGARAGNVSWAKPDERNSSSELRRITTERDSAGNYTDFYEYYWAHLMQGTTWEHIQTWIKDLLLRDPRSRVPRRVFHAWVLLWIIALVVVAMMLWGLWPTVEAPKPWFVWVSALLGVVISAFVSAVLIKRFGDVARYVKAWPPNVAKRHVIRKTGVDLLDQLIMSGDYDRIVVVAHSLGTIIAYDIITMLFAKYNKLLDDGKPREMLQPERHQLEEMVRLAMAGQEPLDIDTFQDQQSKAFAEAKEQGARWIVSDFVTLGAPLTHAEFLIAESKEDLRARQESRLLPTCPPVLEYDGTTKLSHFTYAAYKDRRPEERRLPHHAAVFGYTRWTNLYSDDKAILTGDLISGPLGDAFGLETTGNVLKGIRDIGVLPKLDETGHVAEGHRRSFFSHNNYWALDKGTETVIPNVPHHIVELRKALRILQ
ncbi:hypothetical protein [Roseovarius albus]|nr:hypothetical protein [Roseovarius albus]